MLKAVSCYEYQACEHPGWLASEANLFCDALRHKLIGLLTIFGLASWGTAQELVPAPKNEPDLKNPVEVQTRGPLHEAYAQPFDVKPEAGPIVPKEP